MVFGFFYVALSRARKVNEIRLSELVICSTERNAKEEQMRVNKERKRTKTSGFVSCSSIDSVD